MTDEEEVQEIIDEVPLVEERNTQWGVVYPSGEVEWTPTRFGESAWATKQDREAFLARRARDLEQMHVVERGPLVFIRRELVTTSTPVEIVTD